MKNQIPKPFEILEIPKLYFICDLVLEHCYLKAKKAQFLQPKLPVKSHSQCLK